MPMQVHAHTRSEEVSENEDEHDIDEEEVEKSLLKKVDRRMSILVLIYILNCESPLRTFYDIETTFFADVDRNNVSCVFMT